MVGLRKDWPTLSWPLSKETEVHQTTLYFEDQKMRIGKYSGQKQRFLREIGGGNGIGFFGPFDIP